MVTTEEEDNEGGFKPSRQVAIAASWRLAAELIRRYPRRFILVEEHPGSGSSDCLAIYNDLAEAEKPPGLALIYINRRHPGYIHVEPHGSAPADISREEFPTYFISADDPKDLLDHLCEHAGLPPISHIPVGSAQAATYRIIAAFLQHAMFGRIPWDCRNGLAGYWDGYDDGVRREYFEHFPQAHQRFEALEREKTARLPAHRFWFLLKSDEPVLAFEPEHGLVWDVTGRKTDLFAEYQRHRKIWPVLWNAAGHLLP
jgi:T3SS (YopN, CesT) and YbjN peptide-binding chaperone 2